MDSSNKMSAVKQTLTITVNTLSVYSFPQLVLEVVEQLRGEITDGQLCTDDGDNIRWETKQKKVEF